MAKKLFKSKSNFTLRRLHQSGNYGNIYERDYVTIVNSVPIANNGQIPVYNSPTFKLTVNTGLNYSKKYSYGNWLNNPNSTDSNKWTLGNMPEPNKNDSKIILKPNTKRLTDFACYGSSYELIRASILNIVSKFPAELFVEDTRLVNYDIETDIDINNFYRDEYKDKVIRTYKGLYYLITTNETGSFYSKKLEEKDLSIYFNITNDELFKYYNYYIVENPLFIDLIQNSIPNNSKVDNLRYFIPSFYDFNVIIGENKYEIDNIEISLTEEESNKKCLVNGDILSEIKIYYLENNKKSELKLINFYFEENVLTLCSKQNIRIRPKSEKIESFFNNLNDFEGILLNEKTNFTATFETYLEDEENGVYIIEKKYKWPLEKGGWNLSINGLSYTEYVSGLNALANGYDELYSNSILRDMTHESITNMDLTSAFGDDTIDNTKVIQILKIIGRQFDEIKKYIDNIKNTNVLTYQQDKNKPDYFLTDDLELSGWDVKEILNNVSDGIVSNTLYGSKTINYKSSDANNDFMRRLKLNGKNILRKKGTKQAIEDLMALFGFHSLDWINEYERTNGKGTLGKHKRCMAYNIIEKVYVANSYNFKSENGETFVDTVKRLNQLKDSYNIENINDANVNYINEFQGIPVAEVTQGDKTILVPWFDKNEVYDGSLYFQNNGGWGRYVGSEKYVEITYNNILKLLDNNENLLIDIPEVLSKPHYRIGNGIKYNDNLYYFVNVKNNNTSTYYKWEFVTSNIYDYTISNVCFVKTKNDLYALQYSTLKEGNVYYVESDKKYYKIKDITNHKNENGWQILTSYEEEQVVNIIETNKGNNPHCGSYDGGISYFNAYANLFINSTFNNARNDDSANAKNCGFNIVRYNDSTKCLFYNNETNEISILRNENTNIKPYNHFNSKNEYTEEASLSVINGKEMEIIFDTTYKEFIENDILPYLKQIIPSTTIFSYSFRRLENQSGSAKAKTHQVICNNGICSLYGVSDN